MHRLQLRFAPNAMLHLQPYHPFSKQAMRIADKTAFFLLGEMVEYNHTDIIFNNPKSEKTRDYINGRFG